MEARQRGKTLFLSIDVKLLATVTVAVEAALMVALAYGSYLARKRRLLVHCTLMRVAVPIMVVVMVLVMIPSLLGYLKVPKGLFFAELIIHHTAGSLLILTWIYVNLAFMGWVKTWGGRLLWPMRLAAGFWVVSFALGLHIYVLIY